jgi:hypothetical protein
MHVYEFFPLLPMKSCNFYLFNNVTKSFPFCKNVHDFKTNDSKSNKLKGPKIKALMLLDLCFNL